MAETVEPRIRLSPPKLEIPADNPYKNDLFNRQEFGETLTRMFRRVDENLVVAVDAKWGDGKTSFAKMWTTSLEKENLHYVYFDAYRHDHMGDPFIAFCAEIANLIEQRAPNDSELKSKGKSFLKSASAVGIKLGGFGMRALLTAAISRTLGDAAYKDLKENFGGILDDAAQTVASATENVVAEYTSQKMVERDFRSQLEELGAAIKNEKKFPLVIVIDELDRCRPSFALTLIERVKHYFDVPGISFLFLINMEQLEQYVRAEYGQNVNARAYLLKFFDLTVRLPRFVERGRDDDNMKLYLRLARHFGVGDPGNQFLLFLFRHLRFSYREIERCVATYALYESQRTRRTYDNYGLVALLAAVRVWDVHLFASLAQGRAGAKELSDRLRLDLADGMDKSSREAKELSILLKCFYSTDEELESESIVRERYSNPERHTEPLELPRIIPFLCERLSLFIRE